MDEIKISNLAIGTEPKLLCTVVEEDVISTITGINEAMIAGADLIELRIDKLREDGMVSEVVSRVNAPSLVVCRPKHLDGFFEGNEEKRIERLLKGLESGAHAIDIELTTEHKLRQRVINAVKSKGTPLLICYENFEETPSKDKLLEILTEEVSLGADIAKFAVKANSYEDLVTVLQTTIDAKKLISKPFVAIAMGKFGSASRPLACIMGSSMTYCARVKGKEGAPGQLPVKETREIIDLLKSTL